jgi:hypothetical protein
MDRSPTSPPSMVPDRPIISRLLPHARSVHVSSSPLEPKTPRLADPQKDEAGDVIFFFCSFECAMLRNLPVYKHEVQGSNKRSQLRAELSKGGSSGAGVDVMRQGAAPKLSGQKKAGSHPRD